MSTPTLADALTRTPNGARFHRADLHIHSFGGSGDVTDAAMTPENIVATAKAEKLDVISITDHNSIANVAAAITASAGTGVLVIPGVELSTAEGHLLCYLPTVTALSTFFGRVNIANRGAPNAHCQDAMLACLAHLKALGGFALLAHVDATNGFEQAMPTNTPHRLDILCHDTLLGFEVLSATSSVLYSEVDTGSERVAACRERVRRLGLGARQCLARVLNSDSHTLASTSSNTTLWETSRGTPRRTGTWSSSRQWSFRLSGSTLVLHRFFLRRFIPVSHIAAIRKPFVSRARLADEYWGDLHVDYRDERGRVRSFNIRSTMFERGTLRRLVTDLVKLNPSISLDYNSAKMLLEVVGSTKREAA